MIKTKTKATFEDFLVEHPICKKFADNIDAKAIFNFMSKDVNITNMIDVTEAGRPALLGCLKELEDYYDSMQNPIFKLTDNFNKTVVGRMVATILAPFGYLPLVQINFSKTNKGKYFASATRYEKSGNARLEVVKSILIALGEAASKIESKEDSDYIEIFTIDISKMSAPTLKELSDCIEDFDIVTEYDETKRGVERLMLVPPENRKSILLFSNSNPYSYLRAFPNDLYTSLSIRSASEDDSVEKIIDFFKKIFNKIEIIKRSVTKNEKSN